jgi:hypothetical protein
MAVSPENAIVHDVNVDRSVYTSVLENMKMQRLGSFASKLRDIATDVA